MIIQIFQLSGTMLTCARFIKRGKELVPLSGARYLWSDHAELVSLLKEHQPSTSGDLRTILALPAVQVSLREVTLPFSDRNKLRALLPLELAGDLVDDEQELVCDALPSGDGSLLAGWSTVSDVSNILELFAQAGVDPEIVTAAHLNWHLIAPTDLALPVALVDEHAITLCSQGTPIFCRAMRTDRDTLACTLSALELSKGIVVNTIYRLEGDLLPGEQKLPLPHQLSSQLPSGDLSAEAMLSPLATALAYCSGEIFNLRSGPLAWTGKRTYLFKQFRLPFISGCIALTLLLAEAGLRWYLLSRDIGSVNSSIASIYKEIFPNRKKVVDETSEVKAEIRRLQTNGRTDEVLLFMNLLAQSKDEQIAGISEVEYEGERFRIKGDANSTAAVTALAQKLVAAGWSVDQPEFTTRPDGTTLFQVKGRRGGLTP